MRILKRLQAVCLLWMLSAASCAQQQQQFVPQVVTDVLVRAAIPPESVGIYVQDVAGSAVLANFNANIPYNPASTMKLVTTNAALELLGPTLTWKTQAYIDGTLNGDVLNGNLIIRGTGDPKFVIENLWLFLRRIRAAGIREIRGSLILDRSMFEDLQHDPALFDNDPLKPYNVGPDALLLNYKSIALRFIPNGSTGKVSVTSEPALAAFPIAAPALTNGECGDWRAKLRMSIGSIGIYFHGGYPASCGEKFWSMSPYPLTHNQYFDLAFRRIWADLGGTLKGQTGNGQVTPTARLVAEWDSPAVSEIIRDINKYSNNVMTRQLLLTIGYMTSGLPANPERGATAIKAWLAGKGIEAPELLIENGAGLSRVERIAPQTMGRMLAAAFQSPVMPELMASMPLVGYDGTMRKRLVNHTVAGRAHIKTGLLNEVRAIAGYVLAASGKRYAVVFIINHANAASGYEAQDALLQWVYENG